MNESDIERLECELAEERERVDATMKRRRRSSALNATGAERLSD